MTPEERATVLENTVWEAFDTLQGVGWLGRGKAIDRALDILTVGLRRAQLMPTLREQIDLMRNSVPKAGK